MSTTRKIDGWVRHDADEIMREGAAVTFKPGAKLFTADITATLVIGGKCYTEEEHEAEARDLNAAYTRGQQDRWIPTDDLEAIKNALHRASARIGCPPGDNADADLYRELSHAAELVSRLSTHPPTSELVRAWMNDSGDAMSHLQKQAMSAKANRDEVLDVASFYHIPLYRSPISPEARDKAIDALAKLRNYFGENDKTPHQHHLFDIADQALSALRG